MKLLSHTSLYMKSFTFFVNWVKTTPMLENYRMNILYYHAYLKKLLTSTVKVGHGSNNFNWIH